MASLQYDLYNYIAANSPGSAKAVLDKFGYDASQVDTVEVLGAGLATMVKENGEDALKALLSIHPDREVLTQEFTPATAAPSSNSKSGCGCGGCKGASSALESYLSKVGAPASSNNNSGGLMNVQHGNMLLIGGILILAVAIIVTKK